MRRQEILTVPNCLGFYRIFAFPFILWFVLSGKETLFAVFLTINLLTDVADGYIARRYDMVTEFGARLDSIADNLTYLLAFTGIYMFRLDDFMPHIVSFLVFAGLLLSSILLSLAKFRRFPSLHLYSFKIGGYIQGAFFIILFTVGFITPFYYLMITWSILAAMEHITIQLIIPEMRSDAKGLYWVLREKEGARSEEDTTA
ncbi:MAG: CDP-alcohol phosphatidyltransferase family protein [Marinilabiliales bacterium]|nr:MAG: CDP-alcohol phosphatidyltransferase family protein [Marinilabiliales bacterium]